MRWIRGSLGAGLAVWFATSLAHAEVRIGAATPLTGTVAWLGEEHERGVAMAVAELNEAGGLLGERIELIVADDFCDDEQGVAAAAIDPGTAHHSPNAGRSPEKLCLRHLAARANPCSGPFGLAWRAGTEQGRPSEAGIRGISVEWGLR